MSEELDPYCPHCREVIVPRFLRDHHVPLCAKLAEEKARHEATLTKWFAERKDWVDGTATRDKELAVMKQDHSVGKCIYERRAEMAEKALAEATKYCADPTHSMADGFCRDDGKQIDPAVIEFIRKCRRVGELERELAGAKETHERQRLALEENGKAFTAVVRDRDARIADILGTLKKLRDAVKASGKMNGREYDSLGIEVNNALAKTPSPSAQEKP